MALFHKAMQASPSDPMGVMMDAMEQQMGLKVVRRKEPLEVLVIDHVERIPPEIETGANNILKGAS